MKETNNKLASFKSKSFKGGMFTSLIVAVAIALVVIVNLVFTKLNINVDLTENNLYSITEETKNYLATLEDTIRIYYFAESGKAAEICHKVIEKYAGCGKDIKVVDVDPVLHPNYAESLLQGAGQVEADTVIVVNETNKRAKLVKYEEMIKTEYSYNYQTGGYSQTAYSDIEGQIDAALVYVTTDKLPKVYYTSGHGEITPSDVFVNLITKNSFVMEELDTITASTIPEDCEILLINYPENDFNENDVSLVKAYLDKGGKVIFNASEKDATHSNIRTVLAYVGLDIQAGTVVEADSHYYLPNYPYYILPKLESHTITEGVKAVKKVLAPACYGILVREDAKDTITITKILSTTDDAFAKVDEKTSLNTKVEGVDINGPFMVGALVNEKNSGMQMVVYSSIYIWDDSIIGADTYGNSDLLVNSFKFLADVKSTFNIPAINLNSVPTLSVTESVVKANVILKILVLPLGCLLTGIIIFISRRRSK